MDRFQGNFRLRGADSSSSLSFSKKQAGYCELSLPNKDPNEVRGPGVVATTGDVMVSESDHLLCDGGDDVEIDIESVERVFEIVELPDMMRSGIRLVPQNELKLSFLLRTEPEILCLRGR